MCLTLERVIVVCCASAWPLLQQALHDDFDATHPARKLLFCVNPHAAEGMGTSIAAGVKASLEDSGKDSFSAAPAQPEAGIGWIIALGDMPWVQAQTIATLNQRLLDSALPESTGIFAPAYRGQRGHPVAFAASHGPALMALRGDRGARALFETQPPELIETDDSGILKDIDMPADLNAF